MLIQLYLYKVSKKNTEKFKLEKRTNDAIKSVVAQSLPQVYLLYLRTDCKSNKCPYLHIYPKAIRESPCKYATSHDVTDFHNVLVLRQYDLKPHKGMSIDFVRCSILVLKEQSVSRGANTQVLLPLKREAVIMPKFQASRHHLQVQRAHVAQVTRLQRVRQVTL